MKSIVFYFYGWRKGRLNPDDSGVWVGDALLGYVRAEIVEQDALHALDGAKPRKGETLLNAVEIK